MEKVLLKVKLDIEPVTWGTDDDKKRTKLREAIRKTNSKFGEQYIESLLKEYEEMSITLNCYLTNPQAKDIDNLAKIPIDAIFFSARNEAGYKDWENRITSLTVRKIKSPENALEIILRGSSP